MGGAPDAFLGSSDERRPARSPRLWSCATNESFQHRPVMADEIVELFAPVPPGVLIDATVGGGGHAALLLAARPDCSLVGLDRDRAALGGGGGHPPTVRRPGAAAPRPLRPPRRDHARALHPIRQRCAVRPRRLARPSSTGRARLQLPRRRDRSTCAWTRTSLVGRRRRQRLRRATSWPGASARYGDERFAGRIARAIVAARPIATTGDWPRSCATPSLRRPPDGGHPAKRTFQAIRIEVNGELHCSPTRIDARIDASPRGGSPSSTYHSGEDRIVKDRFAGGDRGVHLPARAALRLRAVRTVRRSGPAPQADRRRAPSNRRADSARLRAAVKLAADAADAADGGADVAAIAEVLDLDSVRRAVRDGARQQADALRRSGTHAPSRSRRSSTPSRARPRLRPGPASVSGLRRLRPRRPRRGPSPPQPTGPAPTARRRSCSLCLCSPCRAR